MTKKQKVWLGIFLAMFVVPEVLFSFITVSLAQLLGKTAPSFLFDLHRQFFIDHPVYLIGALAIELMGVLSLLIFNFKHKKIKAVSVALAIIFLWLSVIFYVGYMLSFETSFP